MAGNIRVFLVALHIFASTPLHISNRAEEVTVKEISEIGKKNIPEICQKNLFLRNHATKGNLLSPQDFVNLRNCNQQYPNCKHKVGMLTTTYAEDSNGKTLIIFEVTGIKKQGCWGYLLQFSDNLEMKNIYFNFDNEDADYKKIIYFRLGFTYNFTVTPIPGARCELEVIKDIYFKLKEEKDMFSNCETPSYTERKRIATKICNMFPRNGAKRWRTTQKLLTEEKCKFVLLSGNSL
ncbi:uncharacterized protein LOC130627045 isoform X2 [Hydractinia symbiolongicarpus]|uniref:uncharacterized protein LOC130627045 isoform X2 n=1 Tax=Hydractinia symbiolongicarpus TaxID=13093 RepID=UPI00254FFE24|nr:uncharacterized protein LOC130627045 isoform X2 [Hydractinia symbiolongicarpus]